MIMEKTWLKLNAFNEEFTLTLEENTYTNNNRKYYWLTDEKDWEHFADITTNYVNIDLDDDECLLNSDFLSCFKNNIWECLQWLAQYLPIAWPINRDWVWGFKLYEE